MAINDNVSPTMERMAESERRLEEQTEKTKNKTMEQNVAFIAQIAAVSAVFAGMQQLTTSVQTLGIASEETVKSMQKIGAAVGIVVGSFQLIRGSIEIVRSLRTAEIGLAAVESYRAVLKSPAKIALVAAGLGTAGLVGGFAAGRATAQRTNTTQVTQNINFNNVQDAGSQAFLSRSSMEVMGG